MADVADPSGLSYPFEPKSNRKLVPGHFFGIDLVEGGWACGRILLAGTGRDGDRSRIALFIGIVDWKGEDRPTAETISGLEEYVDYFCVHLNAFRAFGWTIDGWADIGNPDFPETLGMPGAGARVYRGGTFVRQATREDHRNLKHISIRSWNSTWLSANWHVGGTRNAIASPLMAQRIEEVQARRAAEAKQ